MAAPATPEHLPIYICEMMERLGIERGGGVVPRLSLSYAPALHRCEACPTKKSLPRLARQFAGFCAVAPALLPEYRYLL